MVRYCRARIAPSSPPAPTPPIGARRSARACASQEVAMTTIDTTTSLPAPTDDVERAEHDLRDPRDLRGHRRAHRRRAPPGARRPVRRRRAGSGPRPGAASSGWTTSTTTPTSGCGTCSAGRRSSRTSPSTRWPCACCAPCSTGRCCSATCRPTSPDRAAARWCCTPTRSSCRRRGRPTRRAPTRHGASTTSPPTTGRPASCRAATCCIAAGARRRRRRRADGGAGRFARRVREPHLAPHRVQPHGRPAPRRRLRLVHPADLPPRRRTGSCRSTRCVRQFASDDLLTLLGYKAEGLGLVYGASPA